MCFQSPFSVNNNALLMAFLLDSRVSQTVSVRRELMEDH